MIRFLLLTLLSNPFPNGGEVLIHATSPMTYEGLSHVVLFQEDIISGAKPVGIDGFESLMKMKVSTIVCVDGVVPDVKTAKEYGMKTIHLPLKYDAPSDEQIFDLVTIVARARERGNVYIHCHQGKHRSAAAAAIVSIALGSLTLEEAKVRMHVSETSKAYQGLWDAVGQTNIFDVTDLLQNKKVTGFSPRSRVLAYTLDPTTIVYAFLRLCSENAVTRFGGIINTGSDDDVVSALCLCP